MKSSIVLVLTGFILIAAGLLVWGMKGIVPDISYRGNLISFPDNSASLLATVSPGSNEAVFYFNPEAGDKNVGDTLTVELRMGASEGVTSIKAYVNFDTNILSAQSITKGDSGQGFDNWFEDDIDNTNGVVKLQASEPNPGLQGSTPNDILIAEISFQVVGEGTVTLSHDDTSLALKPDDTDILFAVTSPDEGEAIFTVDDTAPNRSDGSPDGELASSTTSAEISLATNEAATCKYATSSGVSYATMPNTFSTTGNTSHSTTVSGLSTGNSYSYYVRCEDDLGNANSGDYPIEFSVGSSADENPPTRSAGSPTGTLAPGTTSITLSLTTNEDATCRYSAAASTSYASMESTFSTTGETTHSSTISGLTNGSNYSYYVRCEDETGNANTGDYPIEFSIANAPSGGGSSSNSGGSTILKGDFNGDGRVNIMDLTILLSNWKKNASSYDIYADGIIDILDFSALLSNWTG